jgi:hypothetical protein
MFNFSPQVDRTPQELFHHLEVSLQYLGPCWRGLTIVYIDSIVPSLALRFFFSFSFNVIKLFH